MKKRLMVTLVGFNVGGNIPVGLAYLKAYALALPHLRNRITITILDYDILASPEYVLKGILVEDSSLVGFNIMHGSLNTAIKVSRYLKRLRPSTKVILGGVEVTPIADKVLKKYPFVDMIILGEGEKTFAETLESILEGQEPLKIAGSMIRYKGELFVNPPREPLEMDTIPSPYLTGIISPFKYHAFHIETFRGCPYSCSYCNEGRGFEKIRSFSMDRILEELGFIMKTTCKTVKFYDTTFNFNRERTFAILEYIDRNNFQRINFGSEVRMELFDDEMANMAVKANMTDIEAGLQSLKRETHSENNRSFNPMRFEENVRIAVGRGLKVLIHIMGGLPGDTILDTYKAYDYVMSMGAIPCLFHTRVLPGTKLYERAYQEGYLFDPDPLYDMLCNRTFDVGQFHEYNLFGMAHLLLTPYIPLIRCLAFNLDIPPSEIIARFSQRLGNVTEWKKITSRYLWWNAVIDPSFTAYIKQNSYLWKAVLDVLVAELTATLPSPKREIIQCFEEYLSFLEEVRSMEVKYLLDSKFMEEGAVLRLSPYQRFIEFKFNIQHLIQNPKTELVGIKEEPFYLQIVRNATGTLTKAINPQMRVFLKMFSEGATFREAVEKFTELEVSCLKGETLGFFRDTVKNMVEDGVLIPMEAYMENLIEGSRIFLRILSDENIHEVKRIYQDNPAFFELLAGVTEVPLEYIESDMEGIPPNFDKRNKYFMGIFLKDTHQMIGVTDFLISYPQHSKGCFGLLLLSEKFQSLGYGTEAVRLVEKWAYEQHGIREITLGVELVNRKAYSFWNKCNYTPTGEYFEHTVLGRSHKTTLFVKKLDTLVSKESL